MNYLGLNREKTTKTVNQLNRLLANYHIYYQNLRNFHWNIQGEHFFELHEKFEGLYNDARLTIDEIAERILTLRHLPLSRLSDYLEITEIKEARILKNDREMVDHILEDHGILINVMRESLIAADGAGDEGTIDMLSGFLKTLEKKSWMLDAWRARKLQAVEA